MPVTAGGAVAYAVGGNGVIGPKKHETGNGRVLRPAGRMTAVGNFPTGGALTRSGRYYWAVATGQGLVSPSRILARADGTFVVSDPGAGGLLQVDPATGVVTVLHWGGGYLDATDHINYAQHGDITTSLVTLSSPTIPDGQDSLIAVGRSQADHTTCIWAASSTGHPGFNAAWRSLIGAAFGRSRLLYWMTKGILVRS